MIKIENLYKTFFSELGTEKEVFKNLNLEINDGDFITIIGSNGAGKSTLLNVLNGQIMPDKGTVMLNNINLTNVKSKVYRIIMPKYMYSLTNKIIETILILI